MAEIPHLESIAKQYAGSSVKIFLVDVGEDPEKVTKFVTTKGIELPVLIDRYQTVAKKYDALMTAGIDLVLSVGTSSLFPYITMPVEIAHEAGVPSVEINTGRTGISALVTERLEMECDEALVAIWGEG